MKVYLVQHGAAKSDEEDPARPLTDEGREEVNRMARAAARLGLEAAAVIHSGKLRAQQTAEILAEAFRPPKGLTTMAGLAPNDDPSVARGALEARPESLMLVGHLPHLSRLTSLLLVDDPAREIVAFRMAGIVCLARDESRWRLAWMLTPELVSG